MTLPPDFEERRERLLAGWTPTYPWTVRTLRDHVYERDAVHLTCPDCRHKSALDVIGLTERLGPETPLDWVLARIKCHGCGRRGRPEVALVGHHKPGRQG